jgi:chitin disaccharide deacetylase
VSAAVPRPAGVRLHADDLGLHPAVDRAVLRAWEAGAIAGASILVTGPTFKEAARLARETGLPLALHLALVDTAPLSPAREVRSLVGTDGRFAPYFGRVTLRALLRRLRTEELRREVGRQIAAFGEAGLIDRDGLRLDGHQHLHLLPAVMAILLAEARRVGLRQLRIPLRSPAERRERGPRSIGFYLAELLARRAARRTAELGVELVPCWGVLFAGSLTLERARSVLASLPSTAQGQLLCHPGDDDCALSAARPWHYAWETELATTLALAADGETRTPC